MGWREKGIGEALGGGVPPGVMSYAEKGGEVVGKMFN